MKTSKPICPKCGSNNVIFWAETIVITHYKIRKDGKPYKNGHIAYVDGNRPYGYQCFDCGEWCSISDDDDCGQALDWGGRK